MVNKDGFPLVILVKSLSTGQRSVIPNIFCTLVSPQPTIALSNE